jgi:hypothetical protein
MKIWILAVLVFFLNIKKKNENLDTSIAGSGTGHFAKPCTLAGRQPAAHTNPTS